MVLVWAALTQILPTGCLQQQKYVSRGSRDWEVQAQGASQVNAG